MRRFDTTELITSLVAVGLIGLTLGVGITRPRTAPTTQEAAEIAWLSRTYGPSHYSSGVEEWAIRDFFQNRRGGVFVDVGAGDYQNASNTYALERQLGWSGIAIDAQHVYGPGYAQHRPRSRFVAAFVSDRTGDTERLYLSPLRDQVASAHKAFTERWGASHETVDVPTSTLTDLLGELGLKRFDFLNMDIELAEVKALAGFDIERFRPSLVCIEAHPEIRQDLLNYFQRHGYVLLGKYLRLDRRNLYFAPAGQEPAPFPDEVMREWTYHPRDGEH